MEEARVILMDMIRFPLPLIAAVEARARGRASVAASRSPATSCCSPTARTWPTRT